MLSSFLLGVSLSLSVYCQENLLGEDTLKALYSYKFALFTEWPETKNNEGDGGFQFCVIGKNPFGQSALAAIEGKPVKEKNIHVEVFGSGLMAAESLNACHVAFISGSEALRLPAIVHSLQHLPILTISDIPDFSGQGGMITLVKSGDHIKFEVNQNAIKRSGLAISSKIIELATLVNRSKEQRN